MRIVIAIMLVVHGLIHLMGFAKAFGLAELPQLTQPISRPMGLLWLAAGLLCVVAAFLPWRLFWIVGLLAVIVSQAVILSAWSDARAGTLANALVLVAVAYAFAAQGPWSLAAEYAAGVSRAIEQTREKRVLTDADLATLPEPVAKYVRATGAVGQPQPGNVRARWKGRIRGGPADPWMPFTAEQVNTCGPKSERLFLMHATMKGLPTEVFHRFVGDAATFRARLLSLFTVAQAAGPEMNRAETVTILNDLCMLAPGALADPNLQWQSVDSTSARVVYTRGLETVSALLKFDATGMLADFESDDRSRGAADGRSFSRLRWTTPLRAPRAYGPLRLASGGEARWHEPNGTVYTYIEMELLDLVQDVTTR